MKSDEFAFFNQQLAAMLRDGIPLEGAVQRLCAGMRDGALRSELEALQTDLAQGIPLREAIGRRQLPELYQRLVEIGAQSQDLPGVLTLLADHYQRKYALWTRVKGLMVYPVTVLFAAFLLSVLLSYLLTAIIWPSLGDLAPQNSMMPALKFFIWFSPVALGVLSLVAFAGLGLPMLRRVLRWRLPAFRETSLAQVASTLALLLRSGVPLDTALGMVERLENDSLAGRELGDWRRRLASGRGRFSEFAPAGVAFPPLFIWLVSQSGDNLGAGFEQAAELYQSRAKYQTEMILYSALPCSMLALGVMILAQLQPIFSALAQSMNMLGGE